VLAGGRYDYLASHFGFNRSEGLNSAGWAAGIDRLALVLESLESRRPKMALIKEKDPNLIGITFVIVRLLNFAIKPF
jgi:histidyl-tRNA synthetase